MADDESKELKIGIIFIGVDSSYETYGFVEETKMRLKQNYLNYNYIISTYKTPYN